MQALSPLASLLEVLYERYHRPVYRVLDPVEIVWGYSDKEDQAIAGLWAALFAWGRRSVAIQKTQALLAVLQPSPHTCLLSGKPLLLNLRHRTWKPDTLQLLWQKLQTLYERYGSLQAFFEPYRESLWEGVAHFQAEITRGAAALRPHLGQLQRGSASKRLWLWLRWMIRKDEIDPGPWADRFSPDQLYVPLDGHLLSWAREMSILQVRSASWKAVQTLTGIFRQIAPHDPVRYDFALLTASSLGQLYNVTCPS